MFVWIFKKGEVQTVLHGNRNFNLKNKESFNAITKNKKTKKTPTFWNYEKEIY
jgi:hypothetical protein